jgi:hypothetical protein
VEEALLGGGEGFGLIPGGGGETGRQHSIWIIYCMRKIFSWKSMMSSNTAVVWIRIRNL